MSKKTQTIANSKPPPRANPSTAATIGFLQSMVIKEQDQQHLIGIFGEKKNSHNKLSKTK